MYFLRCVLCFPFIFIVSVDAYALQVKRLLPGGIRGVNGPYDDVGPPVMTIIATSSIYSERVARVQSLALEMARSWSSRLDGEDDGEDMSRSNEQARELLETIRTHQWEREESGSESDDDTGEGMKPSQVVVVLVGIPGSGKTTLSTKMVANDDWGRVCQDELGSRKKVYNKATAMLDEGLFVEGCRGVIIDRCNFDGSQRRHWVELAEEKNAYKICVVLPHADDVEFCTERALGRGDDGVHTGSEDWSSIVRRMGSEYEAPSRYERFDGIYWCDERAGGSIVEILRLLR